MKTELIKVDLLHPEPELIRRAAEVLLRGGLVAFPTETVYGLGALALNEEATRRIFVAKGRPQHNPVIAHVADVDQVRQVAAEWPAVAELLSKRFWPGPLTIVLAKNANVPGVVTAGGPTVAVRLPNHRIARALIAAVGQPVAAPSANRSMALSPTTAEHVMKTLDGRIDLVLDGGACSGGIESTVLALGVDAPPRILRLGLISRKDLEDTLQMPVMVGPGTRAGVPDVDGPGCPDPLPSPGMLERHYAPVATLTMADGSGRSEVETLARDGVCVGWLVFQGSSVADLPGTVMVREMPLNPEAYAERLYAALHKLDAGMVTRIVAAKLPDGDEWAAVRDRLQRASVPA